MHNNFTPRRLPVRAIRIATIVVAACSILLSCSRTPERHAPSLIFATSNDVRSGFMKRDGRIVPATYALVNGKAIYEGDIVIGDVSELERLIERVHTTTAGPIHIEGFGTIGSGGRWPGNTVPYCITPGLTNPGRVARAAAAWNAKTTMKIHDAGGLCNLLIGPVFAHVNVVEGTECSSPVGMQGGIQNLTLDPLCSDANVIHEFGHAVGLWHEQSRPDRDNFVTIVVSNIKPNQLHNFNQESGTLLGAYDFASIMHYGAFDFAIDKNLPTIITKPPNIPIGKATDLSPGDIAAVKMLYP